MKHQLAVQLYTLRKECKDNFPQVLRDLRKMGWSGVQMGGFFGYDPQEIAAVMAETGLKAAGFHAGFDQMMNKTELVVEQARILQTKDIVCPFVQPQNRTEEGYRRIKQGLNDVAARLREEGFRISYHNHDFEFDCLIDGHNALEYLLKPHPDNEIHAEIDVYWIQRTGRNPLEFIRAYAFRMPIIHLKDMKGDETKDYAEIGTGTIDFPPLLQWGQANGIEWYVVEQDECRRSPMDCVETSYNNLIQWIRE
ncbi:sugar phosphate isomerase/epimerase family protein [Paenibacillus sp. NPDC056579]|uniref:sugar phosphate isomerase/epimerase family protein n=1 Tax=Paenibacillus sp. NPDC056579 TaxID=3345871 RepID=UPI00368E8B5D